VEDEMPKTRISRERLTQAIESTNGSLLEVSKYLNEPPRRVQMNLEHYRINLTIPKSRLEDGKVQELLENYELSDAAVLLGTSYNTLYRFVQRHNLRAKEVVNEY